MYKLKLTHGLSCKAGKVRATKSNPYVEVEDKEQADNAIATGYFELISSPEDDGGKIDADPEVIPTEKMTVPQLDKYAADNGIDLAGCNNKAEKLNRILEAISSPEDDDKRIDFNE